VTVAELIKVLEGMPQDHVVCLSVYRHKYDSVSHRRSHGEMVIAEWHDGCQTENKSRVIIASSRYDLGEPERAA
jgi:hypothetical protein